MGLRLATISQHIQSSFDETRPPERLQVVLKEAHSKVAPASGLSAAQLDEWAAASVNQIAALLAAHQSACITTGQPCRFAFTVVGSFEYIHGAYWIQPTDSPRLADFKKTRTRLPDYRNYLRQVNDRLFEAICGGVLQLLGCVNPVITRKSGDQGIDFFGQLRLEGRLGVQFTLPGPDRRFNTWLVGQAKRYLGTASTPDLRELVGSVDLARAGAYADDGRALSELNIRVCDPVFYLFLTTGTLSSASTRLVERSGMIALDGDSIASLLTDVGVGMDVNGNFSPELIDTWAAKYLETS